MIKKQTLVEKIRKMGVIIICCALMIIGLLFAVCCLANDNSKLKEEIRNYQISHEEEILSYDGVYYTPLEVVE